jgi:cell division septum initiation protein DivIVA
VDKVKEDEENFEAQAEIQKNEIEDLWKQLAEAKEKVGSPRPTEILVNIGEII